MFTLIKLELIKDNFKKNWRAAGIAALCIIGIMILIGTVETEEVAFTSAAMFFDVAEVMVRATYIIFAGVLVGTIVVGEFKTGTIRNLFVYPIPRKKIIASKLILIFVFTFLMYVLTTLLVYISGIIANPFNNMVEEGLTFGMVIARMPVAVAGAFLTAGIGLISLYFGMLKKSIPSTIVSAVIIAMILSNSNTGEPHGTLYSIVAIPITLCLVGIGVAYFSFRNINKVDIN